MLLYRNCTRSAGHLASRSDDTLRFSHGAPSVFEAQPLDLGAVTATRKEPPSECIHVILQKLVRDELRRGAEQDVVGH
jgi:hypothetical protein